MIDSVCVWLGRLFVIISVVLNLLSVCVNVSSVFVRILCVVSGSVMWKNIVILLSLSVCVVCLRCGLMFLNVVCVDFRISGNVMIIDVIIVFCYVNISLMLSVLSYVLNMLCWLSSMSR